MPTITLPFADLLPHFLFPLGLPLPHFFETSNPDDGSFTCSIVASFLPLEEMGKIRTFIDINSVSAISACNSAALELLEYLIINYNLTLKTSTTDNRVYTNPGTLLRSQCLISWNPGHLNQCLSQLTRQIISRVSGPSKIHFNIGDIPNHLSSPHTSLLNESFGFEHSDPVELDPEPKNSCDSDPPSQLKLLDQGTSSDAALHAIALCLSTVNKDNEADSREGPQLTEKIVHLRRRLRNIQRSKARGDKIASSNRGLLLFGTGDMKF